MLTPEATPETQLIRELGSRRSKRSWKLVIREGYVSYLTVEESDKGPITMDEALKCQQKEHWIQAINRELKSMDENDT